MTRQGAGIGLKLAEDKRTGKGERDAMKIQVLKSP